MNPIKPGDLKPCPFCGSGPIWSLYNDIVEVRPSEIMNASQEEKIAKYGKAAVILDKPVRKEVPYYRVKCWRCDLTMSEAVGLSVTNARTRLFNRWNERTVVE